jgi:tetratricopeptide (TPR) repeat protein
VGAENSTPLAADPLAWFEAERVALVTAVDQASGHGLEELAWDLAGTLRGFQLARGHLDDWRHAHQLALAANERAGNRRGQAHMLRGLGQVHIERDDLERATALLEQALALFDDLDDGPGRAYTLTALGYIQRLLGQPSRALAAFGKAQVLLAAARDRRGQAYVLWNFGLTHREQGRFEEARVCLEQARDEFRAIGDHHYEAYALRSLGLLHKSQGQARGCHALLSGGAGSSDRPWRPFRGGAPVAGAG